MCMFGYTFFCAGKCNIFVMLVMLVWSYLFVYLIRIFTSSVSRLREIALKRDIRIIGRKLSTHLTTNNYYQHLV